MGQLIRYFLRSKLAKFAAHVQEMEREQRRAQQSQSRPKEDISVDYIPKSHEAKRKKDIEGGEYNAIKGMINPDKVSFIPILPTKT